MKQRFEKIDVLTITVITLLIIISIAGIFSLDFTKSYEIINQYGDIVEIYGNGIYAHDSYFKAPILIGTDITMLFVVVPLFILTLLQNRKYRTSKTELNLLSVFSVALYYAASLAFGVTYNEFQLLYIALFSSTLFGVFTLVRKIGAKKINYRATKGISIFLVMTGISLIAAWLPDILPTVFTGKSLIMIEVYTTEITYVLDMGIIGPLCLVCLYLLKKKDELGIVLLAVLLKCCIVVGIMMIPQTICQVASGYETVIPILLIKSGSFVLLGGFALHFNYHLYHTVS